MGFCTIWSIRVYTEPFAASKEQTNHPSNSINAASRSPPQNKIELEQIKGHSAIVYLQRQNNDIVK